MKKIMIIMLVSIALMSSINADIYASLKLSSGSGTESVDYEYGSSRESSFSMSEFSTGIGYIFSNNNRIELNTNSLDGDSNRDILSLGFDYIFRFDKNIGRENGMKITPEVTLGGRYYTIDKPESTGIGFKVGGALVSRIIKDLELGIGIDYNFVDWEAEDTGYYRGEASITDKMYSFNIFSRFIF